MFVDQTWGVIREQKELNLPDQREMVANYRCNEIKDEAIQKVKAQVESIQGQSALEIIKDFGSQCQAVITQASSWFQEKAKQYNPEVYGKVMNEL